MASFSRRKVMKATKEKGAHMDEANRAMCFALRNPPRGEKPTRFLDIQKLVRKKNGKRPGINKTNQAKPSQDKTGLGGTKQITLEQTSNDRKYQVGQDKAKQDKTRQDKNKKSIFLKGEPPGISAIQNTAATFREKKGKRGRKAGSLCTSEEDHRDPRDPRDHRDHRKNKTHRDHRQHQDHRDHRGHRKTRRS